MKANQLISICLGVMLLISSPLLAQTCSCAAVPILGSMESASPKNQQWYVSSTYQFHDTSELVAGSTAIPDATGRDRTSEAVIIEISRGFTEKWSASALFSAVDHHREVNNFAANASGIGDSLLMVKYAPKTISLYSDTTLSFGLGVRIPVGENNAKQGDIVLAEDMQPSTGAFGGVAWTYWSRALTDSKATRIYAGASYAKNGENDRKYSFGEEVTVSFGGSYQTQTPWGFNLELYFRDADRDQRNSVEIPNTGGQWLDAIPAVQYHLTENLALTASAQLPIARNLNDELQFTSKYAYRLSISYVLGGVQ